MADRMAMRLGHDQRLAQKQTQRLIMLPEMQQALALLQMPVMELAAAVEIEMEQNPILETSEEEENSPEEIEEQENLSSLDEKEVSFEDENFEVLKLLDEEFREHFDQDNTYSFRDNTTSDLKRQTFLESLICREESLRDHLIRQAQESFDRAEEFRLAELLIGYLDQNGYLATPLQEIALMHESDITSLERVLAVVQTFDPVGIAAPNLQEALLMQLRSQGKEQSLAYMIVREYWEDLLHHRIPAIAKGTGFSSAQVSDIISADIAKLDLHPGGHFTSSVTQHIVPDVVIRLDGESLVAVVNDEPLPTFRFNSRYLRMLDDPALPVEARDFIKQKLGSARWLSRTIDQRHNTLHRIAESLIRSQETFFSSPEGQLKPLTMKSLAEELGVHESTIARAVVSKYMASPRGLLSLRSFFTNTYVTEQGHDISSKTVQNILEALIAKENKVKPLSDDALSRLLKAQGIPCARRTVAKYRGELRIGNATQRRVYP